MLHQETLTLLHYFSSKTKNFILEIGPYIGGSTLALASPRNEHEQMVLTIEPGGSYLNHPHLPSKNILSDLRQNILKYKQEKKVAIFQGYSYEENIISKIKKVVGPKTIDLLFIDADGDVGRDVSAFWDKLSNECILVLDDYFTSHSPEKQTLVQRWVNNEKINGKISELCVVKWGTWFGKINKTTQVI